MRLGERGWNQKSFDEFHDRLDPLVRRLARGVHPVFAIPRGGTPRHIGSCVLLRVGEGRFLLTAAHVLDEFGTETLFVSAAGKLRAVKGQAQRSMPEKGQRRNSDRIDAAVLRLDDTERALDDSFLTLRDVDARDHFDTKPRYLLFGYPAKKSRLKPETRSLTSEPFRYVGYNASPQRYLGARIAPFTHVALIFDIRRTGSKYGIVEAPTPIGVSGGGIFSAPALIDECAVGEAKLVAVFTDFQRQRRLLVGTRINYHFEIMRATWPDVASLLPRHGMVDLQMRSVEPWPVPP